MKVLVELEREEVYDLCDALTTEAERLEAMLSRRIEAPEASRRGWQKRIPALRELSRRLIAECFTNQRVA